MLRDQLIKRFNVLARGSSRDAPGGSDQVVLRPGDNVLVQIPQCIEATSIFWRCMEAGAVFVPIDRSWPDYLIERATAGISPRAIVTTKQRSDALERIFPGAMLLEMEGAAEKLTGSGDPQPGPQSDAVYLFTSGSTGVPKAVVHSRASLAHSAALALEIFGWRQGERLLNLAELHTMSGLRNSLIAAPMGGVDWLPFAALDQANFFDLIEVVHNSGCEHVVAGPAFVRQLGSFGDRIEKDRFSRVKAIYSTGAHLPADAAQAVFERFGLPVINYYGLTETGGICLSQRREDWTPHDTSLGRPVGCEARLIGMNGAETNEGELQVKSSQLMTAYLNDPEATAHRFDHGWLKTGDVMSRDEDGNFHLRGRADLFIKTRSTDRVHPEEIETVLELHPAVAEAGVVGVENPSGGEHLVVLAAIRGGGTVTPVALADFVVERLGPSRKPTEVRLVASLPRLASGKLNRPELRALLS